MKGLLIKDVYMLRGYCRVFILLMLIMFAALIFTGGSSFFILYTSVLTGTLPVTALSYDDREKWCVYCQTLPVTRAQYVAGKYVLGLGCAACAVLMTAACALNPATDRGMLAALLPCVPLLVLTAPSLCLPLFFRLGAEKGRTAYLFIIVVLCAGASIVSGDGASLPAQMAQPGMGAAAIIAAAVLYGASWLLSTRFYAQREL